MKLIALHYQIKEKILDNRYIKIFKIEDFKTGEEFALQLYTSTSLEKIKTRFTPNLMYDLTKITHPNLISIKDFGIHDDSFYTITEYCKCKSFDEFTLKEDNIDLFYEIIVKICHGLDYLYSKHLLHKGLKTENIIVNRDDPDNVVVKLLNYGERKIIVESESQSPGIDISFHYLAPEVLHSGNYNMQTDLFALGVSLYKIAVGNFPYSINEMNRVKEKDFSSIIPQFPSKINPLIDRDLEKLLFKLIAFNPTDRFRNPREVVEFINSVRDTNYIVTSKTDVTHHIESCRNIIREEDTKKLIPYIKRAIDGSGGMGFMVGDKGVGKKSAMQYEKFQILLEKSLIMHYHCDSNHKDPFFMLTKEIFFVMNQKGKSFFRSEASEKFQEFLFKSEERSRALNEDKKSLEHDFELVKEYLTSYSQEQSIIFFISDIDRAEADTIDFLKYLADDITNYPFLVITSTYDQLIPRNFASGFSINMKPLNKDQTKNFVNELLKTAISQNLADKIYYFSSGNQLIIREFVKYLYNKKLLQKYSDELTADFKEEKVELPQKILNVLKLKLDQIPHKMLDDISKIAAIRTPYSYSLLKYVFHKKSKKEVFKLFKKYDKFNIFKVYERYKKQGYFRFIYPWLKRLLIQNLSRDEKNDISQRVISYFRDKEITEPLIIRSILEHCKFVEDKFAEIYFSNIHMKINEENKDYVSAWKIAYKTVKKAAKIKDDLDEKVVYELVEEFLLLSYRLKKTEFDHSVLDAFEELIEQNFMLSFLRAKSNIFYDEERSLKFLDIARNLATKKQLPDVSFVYVNYNIIQGNIDEAEDLIAEFNLKKLTKPQKARYYLLNSIISYVNGNYDDALDYINSARRITVSEKINWLETRVYLIRADIYNKINEVDQAKKEYLKAVERSVEVGDIYNLALSYCSWGELYYKTEKLGEGLDKIKGSLEYFNQINNPAGKAGSHLNMARIYYKFGDYKPSNQNFLKAIEIARRISDDKLLAEIKDKYSFLKFKIDKPAAFLDFLKENYTSYFDRGKIEEINSFLKNYIFSLNWYGREKEMEEVLEQIKTQDVDLSLEQEFVNQVKGLTCEAEGKYEKAVNYYQKSFELAEKNQNNYAMSISYFNLANAFYGAGKLKQANINCKYGLSLARKNDFRRWINYGNFLTAKIDLKDSDKNYRNIIRKLIECEKISRGMKDWAITLQVFVYTAMIYQRTNLYRRKKKTLRKINHLINPIHKGMNKKNRELLDKKFKINLAKQQEVPAEIVAPRKKPSLSRLQHIFLDIIHFSSIEHLKTKIQEIFHEIFGFYKFAIYINDEKFKTYKLWLHDGIEEIKGVHEEKLEAAHETKAPVFYKVDKIHYGIALMVIKSEIVGHIIFCDKGEFPFNRPEKSRIGLASFYLAVILKKTDEYAKIVYQKEQLSILQSITRDLLQITEIEKLKERIIVDGLRLVNADHGFFITLDKNDNFVFDVSLNAEGEIIQKKLISINYDILRDAYENLVVQKRELEQIEKNYFVYCAPIKVKKGLFGLIYFDAVLDEKKAETYLNDELMEVFLLNVQAAINNSLDYRELTQANKKLLEIEKERTKFINIASHEFNTPIQIIKGYMSVLKNKDSNDTLKKRAIKILDNNIKKLSNNIDNVMQLNALEKVGTDIMQQPIDVKEILNEIYEELVVFAENRHQNFTLDIGSNLAKVKAEKNSLSNAIKNLVLNAIKYTDDYGEITLGARRSRLKKEQINNEQTMVIFVKDTGVGISAYELDNIFKEFYEVQEIKSHHSGVTEFKSSGLGLGLSLTKSIVELFDGKIWVKSRVGEGSIFYIALPIFKEE